MSVHEVSQNALSAVGSPGQFLVLDFTATWCPPCKVMNPVFHSLAEDVEFKSVAFASIDVDENQQLSQDHRVMSIPTFLVMKKNADGTLTEIKRMVGAQDPLSFRQEIAKAVAA